MSLTTPDRTTGTALVMESIDKQFGGRDAPRVLDNVSLTASKGEFVSIVGPSGCGKTTLLRIIQGLDKPTAGSVTRGDATDQVGRMSYVFQRPTLLPWYDVRTNVALGPTMKAGREIYTNKSDRQEAVDALLELTGLSAYADYYPHQISGGMQQRVNVARALAVKPHVLLLDEPFSALDALTRERLQVDIATILSTLGTTAVLVTHDIRESVFMSDRVVVMGADPGHVRDTVVVDVDEARPRSAAFQHSSELATIERRIWTMLHTKS